MRLMPAVMVSMNSLFSQSAWIHAWAVVAICVRQSWYTHSYTIKAHIRDASSWRATNEDVEYYGGSEYFYSNFHTFKLQINVADALQLKATPDRQPRIREQR